MVLNLFVISSNSPIEWAWVKNNNLPWLLLYPKSNGVPAHWPRRISGPILHVFPHPRGLNGDNQGAD